MGGDLTVSMTISDGPVTQIDKILYQRDMTVQAAMEEAFDVQAYDFRLQYLGAGYGYDVIAINGIAGSPETGRYWFLFVNDVEQETGVEATVLQPGDRIAWRYLSFDGLTGPKVRGRARLLHESCQDLLEVAG